MIEVEPDVFLASPGDLDRLADLFRQNGRFGHIVRLRFASKGAAQKSDMTDHIFWLNADRLGHRLLHVLRALGRGPDFHFPGIPHSERCWWLHWSVSQ